MTTTLKDVARRAGVSIKTVSNVVNGNVRVTDEKRQRVLAALDELNYQPNLPARYLRKGRVGVLAFAIPDLSNSYFSDIGNAIITAASDYSYTVLIDSTGGERAKENLLVNGLRPHLIDGIILSPLALEAEDLQPGKARLPLVLLGERFLDVPYDHVAIDNVAASHLAVDHLLSLGRRRIAAIGAQENRPGETTHLRLRGYTEALTAANCSFDPQLVVEIKDYHRDSGLEAMRRLLNLDEPPDAVFCFNDLLALGAMRAIYEAGYRMPEDIAVVGFDDIEDGRFAVPSLTTIAPDKEKIGATAVSLLLARIDGTRTVPPEHVEVPFSLIARESTIGRSASDTVIY